jgi:hypothetical protein
LRSDLKVLAATTGHRDEAGKCQRSQKKGAEKKEKKKREGR